MTKITADTRDLLVRSCLLAHREHNRTMGPLDLRTFAIGWFASRFTTRDVVMLLVRETKNAEKRYE